MQWIEQIKIQALPDEEIPRVKSIVSNIVQNKGGEEKPDRIAFIQNLDNEAELAIILSWDNPQIKKQGSFVAQFIIHVLADHGLTNLTIWRNLA